MAFRKYAQQIWPWIDFRALKLPLKTVYNPAVGIAINKPVVFIDTPTAPPGISPLISRK
jgi:hypothetical protein